MQLKVKASNWSAGLPVVMLNKKTANKIGIHAKERIFLRTIKKNPREISAILDIVQKGLKENEINISLEVKKILKVRAGNKVEVNFSHPPKSLEFIKEKLNNKVLSEEKIKKIILDIVENRLSEAEIALFISAVYKNAMNLKEKISLIKAILSSGRTFSLKNKYVVDKHSIGGIPGNRTTPLVVAICAAAGLIMPKSSSRAITSAAGTADVIETIAKVEFPMNKVKKIVQKTGACMVWGGALGMVPADSKIISVEKQLKIDSEALLLSSIMSKKLAVGSKYIIIDIPYGKNAKVSKQKALKLKRKFEELGKYFKLKLKVVLTEGHEPIGNGIGPVLELRDILDILDSDKQGPKDLEKKSLFLAGEIFELTKKARKGKGYDFAKKILDSGKAFDKFKEIIKAQEGKVIDLKVSKHKKVIYSSKKGIIKEINNKKVNSLARVAGCPIDKYSGIYLHQHVGDKINKESKLITLYAESKSRLNEAFKAYNEKDMFSIR